MQGPNEFVISGNLKGWQCWDRLPQLSVKTLVIGAEFDTMDPKEMLRMGDLLPNGRTVIIKNAPHIAFYDGEEEYFQHLMAFLKEL